MIASRGTDTGFIAAAAARVDAWWDALVGPPSGPEDPAFPWRRHILTAAGIVGYAGLDAARSSLDAALSKVHPADSPGFSANDLHGGRSTANLALRAWEEGSRQFDRFLLWSGRSLAVVVTVLELALLPFSAVLLYSIVRFLRNELQRADAIHDEQGGRPEQTVPPWRTAPHQAVLRICTLAVVVYLLLGLSNQFLELAILLRDQADSVTAVPLQVGHYVRRGALILTLVPAAITALMLARNHWHPITRIREAGSAYRILGVLAGVHFVLLLTSVPAEQGRDAIRLWPENGWLAVWGVLATASFSLALAALALRLGTLRRPGGEILRMAGTMALTGAGVVIALVGLALHRWASWGNGVTALGIVLGVVGLLSVPILSAVGDQLPGRRRDAPSPQTQVVVPAVLATTPMLALAIAIIEAGTPELITTAGAWWLILIAIIVCGLAVFAYVAARWYGEFAYRATRAHERGRTRRFLFAGVVGGLFLGSLVMAGWVIADPWDNGSDLGVHGLLGSFLVLVTVAVGSIGYLAEGRALPASLDFVGLRRVPLVTSLIVWGLVGNALPDDSYHAIRVMKNQPADAVRSLTVEDAFVRWHTANVPDAGTVSPQPGSPRTVPGVPLVMVMAAGGGLRAATFTSYALDCLFSDTDPVACTGDDDFVDPDSWSNVFMASGASGGSVGIASVVASREAGGEPVPDWIASRLGTDLLSPELGWQLFVEVPNTLLTFNPGLDRAEVLERTWEHRFADEVDSAAARPFFATAAGNQGTAPLLFLNGTNLPDGCRVTISPGRTTTGGAAADLAAPGATARDDCRRRRLDNPEHTLDQIVARDLTDFLCPDEDIALSTAAFLSSRFPMVAPTGIVPDLQERRPDCRTASSTGELSIGDAGYRDNTGAAAVADVWSELDPIVAEFNRTHDTCVVPLLVEIDNGHRNQRAFTPPGPSIQLTAPLQGALGVFSSRDAGPVEAMAAEFSRALGPDIAVNLGDTADAARFARLSLFEHPGVLAPLGWSLSTAAVRDLQNQLDDVDQNRATVETIGSWLTPGSLTCTISE